MIPISLQCSVAGPQVTNWINWFMNPINYSNFGIRNLSEIGVMFTSLAI